MAGGAVAGRPDSQEGRRLAVAFLGRDAPRWRCFSGPSVWASAPPGPRLPPDSVRWEAGSWRPRGSAVPASVLARAGPQGRWAALLPRSRAWAGLRDGAVSTLPDFALTGHGRGPAHSCRSPRPGRPLRAFVRAPHRCHLR